MRRFHRWLGVGSAVFVLLAAVTGLLWAYAPYLYWESGYMERKHPVTSVTFDAVSLTHQDAIRLALKQLGEGATVIAVNLRSELDLAVYEVASKHNGKKAVVLIDARTGELLSPLTTDLATRIARQYVPGDPAVRSVTLLDKFTHRKGKVWDSVYQVRFQLPRSPEILLSADSGEIIEESDDVRRFHFWVMRLHQLNFFGFHKTLTIVPGAALLILTVSGIALSRRRKSRAERA
jgi:uncharacterized membrane protein YkoI